MTSPTSSSADAAAAPSRAVVEPLLLTPEQTRECFPAVFGFVTSYFPCVALHAVVRLRVPDAIGSGCWTVDEIVRRVDCVEADKGGAEKTMIRAEALHRCLRLLATCGFFEESAAGPEEGAALPMYRLTPMGALLQTNASAGGTVPQPSLASAVLHMMGAPMWDAWKSLDSFVMGRASVSPWEAAHGMPVFDYLLKNEEDSEIFNDFMSNLSATNQAVLTGIVPWADYEGKRVVDVGGGFGTIGAAVKASFPKIDMLSLDLPEVVEQARATGQAPPDDAVTLVGGDMFDASTYPDGISAVMLKHIMHDWDDENCLRVLQACHKALPDDGKVLVVDAVLPNSGEKTEGMAVQYHVDLLMMLFAGKERTKRQWSELAASSGFKVESFHTDSPMPNLMLTTLVKE